jgi:hypothetical protein
MDAASNAQNSSAVSLLIAWMIVSVLLAWGIYYTVLNSMKLFQ